MPKTVKGKCDACEKEPRVVTQIESGDLLCRTCLRELRPPRAKHFATPKQLEWLRARGVNVGFETTKEEAARLRKILRAREIETRRLQMISSARERGLNVSSDATIEQTKQLLASLASPHELEWLRTHGVKAGQHTTKEEAHRLRMILKARDRGADVRDDATIEQVEQSLASLARSVIRTKVRGVTATNPDGSDRQAIVRRCKPREMLLLVREPHNRYDRNAVAVYRRGGLLSDTQQIGYISAELAEEIATRIDSGERVEARVLEVAGGGGGFLRERKNFGLNIALLIYGDYWME